MNEKQTEENSSLVFIVTKRLLLFLAAQVQTPPVP